MKSLLDYNLDALRSLMEKIGEKPFRANQIYNWVFIKGALNPFEMPNLPYSLRDKLRRDFTFEPFEITSVLQSNDGSLKILFTDKDADVESVALTAKDGRTTFCLSTQSGCPLGCVFCATGRHGFRRNLLAGEIVFQVLTLTKKSGRPDNIVLMGMGEPFLNYDETCRFVEIITDPAGFGFSERRITISTAGLIGNLRKFHRRFPKVELAISINASNNVTRKKLMPSPDIATFDEIINAIPTFDADITLEYVMIAGINDSKKDAERLAGAIDGFRNVKVNLIALNKTVEPFKTPSMEKITDFQNIIRAREIRCFIRQSAGFDINAACGQLAGRRRD